MCEAAEGKAKVEALAEMSDLEEDESEDESDDDECATVERFEYNGTVYLKAEDNTLYDYTTHEVFGEWDSENNEVVEYESDDE